MEKARKLVEYLKEREAFIVTMESCTGGALASAITDVPGASEVLMDSFVTYSNAAKFKLGVSEMLVDRFTVYSKEIAGEMAQQAIRNTVAAGRHHEFLVGVGITGSLTREDPANPNSIPGTVYYAVAIQHPDRATTPIWRGFTTVTCSDRHEGKGIVVDRVLQAILESLAFLA